MTGLGMVTPLGGSTEASWSNLIAGKSGTVALDPSRFPRFAPEHISRSLTSRVVAPVSQDFVDEVSASVRVHPLPLSSDLQISRSSPHHTSEQEIKELGQYVRYAATATREALDHAGLFDKEHQKGAHPLVGVDPERIV